MLDNGYCISLWSHVTMADFSRQSCYVLMGEVLAELEN